MCRCSCCGSWSFRRPIWCILLSTLQRIVSQLQFSLDSESDYSNSSLGLKTTSMRKLSPKQNLCSWSVSFVPTGSVQRVLTYVNATEGTFRFDYFRNGQWSSSELLTWFLIRLITIITRCLSPQFILFCCCFNFDDFMKSQSVKRGWLHIHEAINSVPAVASKNAMKTWIVLHRLSSTMRRKRAKKLFLLFGIFTLWMDAEYLIN